MQSKNLTLSFDIGHSSIGWAVCTNNSPKPVLGCGSVIFKPDDCLAISRAGFRRQRRNIAARRNRIKRLRYFFVSTGLLSKEEVLEKPISQPWLLAAKTIRGQIQLSPFELFSVIRWYAHNRGYDGNALWAEVSTGDEDTEKLANANALLEHLNTSSMAESVCKFLEIDIDNPIAKSSRKYFKGQNAAFPREIVYNEVLIILNNSKHLQPVTDKFIEALCGKNQYAWKAIECAEIRLPKRFHGGLLFGQMIPRFNNRIITECRISGKKTPLKHCRDFYYYRWGMLMVNLHVEDPISGMRSLTPEERTQLTTIHEQSGSFSKTTLTKALINELNLIPVNVEAMFLSPEMEKALVLDPVKALINSKEDLKIIWPTLSEKFKKILASKLYKSKKPIENTLSSWRGLLSADNVDLSNFDQGVDSAYDKAKKRSKKELSRSAFTNRPITFAKPSGRSPYSKKLLRKAWVEITETIREKQANPTCDPRAKGGCLEETAEVLDKIEKKKIDSLTNNHLVRHRILIFERLFEDLIKHYAKNDISLVETVAIEVIRDFQEYSAKTTKEVKQLLGLKMAHHKRIVKQLEEAREEANNSFEISAGLIKKARILDDMGKKCPFTGQIINITDLVNNRVDREHIIPYSLRPSDSLESLVITFKEVNRMKGQMTAREFIAANEGKAVDGMEQFSLFTLKQYDKFVSSLQPKSDPRKRNDVIFIDDLLRKWRRKQFLQLDSFEPRTDKAFTGRDLTQTSYISKLAAISARKKSKALQHSSNRNEVNILYIPGSVTAAVRRNWKTIHCLSKACPETIGKSKSEIRELTHLHHAVDAVTMGLASIFLCKNSVDGKLAEILTKRTVSKSDKTYLSKNYKEWISVTSDSRLIIKDLPKTTKDNISNQLLEKRVVMHLPKSTHGLKVQQNMWRIEGKAEDEGRLLITQSTRDPVSGKRKKSDKSENASKLLGANHNGKLSKLKAALVIEENYGVALTNPPKVMPFVRVSDQLKSLPKNTIVLRKGQVIEVNTGRYSGIWRIHSVKDNRSGIAFDLTSPETVKAENKKPKCKMNVLLLSLVNAGLSLCEAGYHGYGQ